MSSISSVLFALALSALTNGQCFDSTHSLPFQNSLSNDIATACCPNPLSSTAPNAKCSAYPDSSMNKGVKINCVCASSYSIFFSSLLFSSRPRNNGLTRARTDINSYMNQNQTEERRMNYLTVSSSLPALPLSIYKSLAQQEILTLSLLQRTTKKAEREQY